MLLDGFFETLNEFTEIIKKKLELFTKIQVYTKKKSLKLLIMNSYINQALTYFHQ